MFLTLGSARVLALDARTGREIWRHDTKLTGAMNRGVALLDDRVFVGTFDARLMALSAATGEVLWDTQVSPDSSLYSVTSAPLAVGDLVVTGVATHGGGRGFIVALDKESGRERWRCGAEHQRHYNSRTPTPNSQHRLRGRAHRDIRARSVRAPRRSRD